MTRDELAQTIRRQVLQAMRRGGRPLSAAEANDAEITVTVLMANVDAHVAAQVAAVHRITGLREE